MTTQEIKSQLTEKEVETFECLVRLGDTVQMAYDTVIKEREKVDNSDVYVNAYHN